MKSLIIIVCFYFLSYLPINGQIVYSLKDEQITISKLSKEIGSTTSDSTKAYLYFKLSLLYNRLSDTVNAKYNLDKGIALSDKNAFIKAISYYYTARYLYHKNALEDIKANFLKADSLLRPFNSTEANRIKANIWYNYGTILQNHNQEAEALKIHLNKSLEYARKAKDILLEAAVSKTIAIAFMNADQREKAEHYLTKASELIEQSSQDSQNRQTAVLETYILSAENYINQDKIYPCKENLEKAWKILSLNPKSTISMDYYYVEGLYFDKIKQHRQALISLDKGLAFPGASLNPFFNNRLKHAKFVTLIHLKLYKEAALLMENLLKSEDVFINDKKMFYYQLAEVYAQMGNMHEAFQWSKRYISLSDSLYEKKYQNDIVELEAKYKVSESQRQIESLKAEKEKVLLISQKNGLINWLLGILSIFLLAVALFSLLLFRNNKKLTRQKEINYLQQLKESKQNQEIRVANALIEGEENERKRLAGDLHDGLGGMLAGVKLDLSRLATNSEFQVTENDLFRVIEQLDTSTSELRRIARNLMPESLLHLGLKVALQDMCSTLNKPDLQVNFQAFSVENNLTKDIQIHIYRIVQELLTNAVKHAQASQILVQCSQNGNRFFITVEDNGKGFDPDIMQNKNGIGLENIKRRVNYLKGEIEIISAYQEGTTINIEFDSNG